ncbi:Hypothetical predicted protein [Prunus dulcis]|uniref:Uncharacterized protein n=1 Tax=Prunus dulcis TaxID=3755 RepID=A0A5E4EGT5_PRUDU|nr:Hypothetical predicted protein [Prunus dulcis]
MEGEGRVRHSLEDKSKQVEQVSIDGYISGVKLAGWALPSQDRPQHKTSMASSFPFHPLATPVG